MQKTSALRPGEPERKLARRLFEDYWHPIAASNPRHARATIHHPNISDELRGAITDSVASVISGKPRGLLLMGDVGVGKTSLLFIIWRRLMKLGAMKLVMWHKLHGGLKVHKNGSTTPSHWLILQKQTHSLLRTFGCTKQTHSELVEGLRDGTNQIGSTLNNARPLLIDDFGRSYADSRGWNVSLQDSLFDLRWRCGHPTYVTTNLTPEGMRSMGREWDAIVDRIADPAWMEAWTIGGPSQRK